MTTAIEALKSVFETFMDDEPKPPLHIGEAMACWTYLAILNEASRYLEIALNTTTDKDLSQSLVDSRDQCQSESRQLTDFMRHEGLSLPPTSEAKPKSEPDDIPIGVKMTDDEIANGLSIKTVAAILHCAASASESIRSDVGMMFTQFQAEKLKYGATLKVLMKKRGWLKTPPYYNPPGLPES